ncbi:MAG: FadR/GntR family transcriptional regulator [Rikenellaceae bacterium]
MASEAPKHIIVNGSVAKQVTKILTDQIIDGKYSVGDYLPTEELLCAEFGIGRSSVREAVKTMESQGLVRKLQGKGIVVIDETIEATAELLNITLNYKRISLQDMVDFREAMEIRLAGLAAVKSSADDIKRIDECLESMRKNKDSYEDFAHYDHLFHEAIAEASGSSISALIMRALRPLLQKQIAHNIQKDFNPQEVIDIHSEILAKIKAHQAKAAGSAMADHLTETHRVLRMIND